MSGNKAKQLKKAVTSLSSLVGRDEAHNYFYGDRKFLGTTSFIKEAYPLGKMPLEKMEIVKENVPNYYNDLMQKGTNIHNLLEDAINAGRPIAPPERIVEFSEHIQEVVGDTCDFLNEIYGDSDLLLSEVKLFSETLGIAGTTDLIVVEGDQIIISDFKTCGLKTKVNFDTREIVGIENKLPTPSDAKYKSNFIQMAFYGSMFYEMFGKQLGIKIEDISLEAIYIRPERVTSPRARDKATCKAHRHKLEQKLPQMYECLARYYNKGIIDKNDFFERREFLQELGLER